MGSDCSKGQVEHGHVKMAAHCCNVLWKKNCKSCVIIQMFADLAVCYSNMHTVFETNWTIRHMIKWISTINYIYKQELIIKAIE